MNSWEKSGVLHAVFEKLQRGQLIRIKIEAGSRDSTIVKVHPDGTCPLTHTARKQSANLAVVGCRRCSNGHSLRSLARSSS